MLSSNKKRCLGWWREEVHDPYNPEYWTAINVSVMSPMMEKPYVSVLISFSNANGRVTMRVRDIKEASEVVVIPIEDAMRLESAVIKGNKIADEIEKDYKLIFERRKLPPGVSLIRTDTGEIISEAEKILREGK